MRPNRIAGAARDCAALLGQQAAPQSVDHEGASHAAMPQLHFCTPRACIDPLMHLARASLCIHAPPILAARLCLRGLGKGLVAMPTDCGGACA